MIDVDKCFECEHSYSGGFWEVGDGYTKCKLLNEIVFFEYGPTYADDSLECPIENKEDNTND